MPYLLKPPTPPGAGTLALVTLPVIELPNRCFIPWCCWRRGTLCCMFIWPMGRTGEWFSSEKFSSENRLEFRLFRGSAGRMGWLNCWRRGEREAWFWGWREPFGIIWEVEGLWPPFKSWLGEKSATGRCSTARPWLRLREWCEPLLRACGLKNLFLL